MIKKLILNPVASSGFIPDDAIDWRKPRTLRPHLKLSYIFIMLLNLQCYIYFCFGAMFLLDFNFLFLFFLHIHVYKIMYIAWY